MQKGYKPYRRSFMELKEARYILAIAYQKSISKAAESLFISQPSLSKYLKNIEGQLGIRLFNRVGNSYVPTYAGERYLYYAENIVNYGGQWMKEFDDLLHKDQGRLNITIPIMLSHTIVQPTLPTFYKLYPHVKVNLMEEMNFAAEHTLEDPSIDLVLYNVHEFPKSLDYQVLREEEIILILSRKNPLCQKAIAKDGFRHPWLDLSLMESENFILLYPDQNTGGIALKLFEEYRISPNVLLHTRNSQMSINLAISGLGAAFAPESYYKSIPDKQDSRCFSIGHRPIITTMIAAHQRHRYLPTYAKVYVDMLAEFCMDQE